MEAGAHWIERRERALYWLVDAALAGPLEALGWPDPKVVAGALLGAAGRSASATAGGHSASATSGGRAATAILALSGRPERIHLRPVRHGGLLAPVWRGAILGFARPVAELRANARLFGAGAPVPQPVLVAAHRARGPLWSAVVGTVHVEGARDGLAWLAARPARDELVRGARAIGTAIRRFHDAGGSHADLQIKNLLLRTRGGETDALVIDLDRARAVSPPSPARRMLELSRLVRSLHKRGVADQVGARGAAAALSAYCAGDRDLRRALLVHLPRERRRVARHRWLYR